MQKQEMTQINFRLSKEEAERIDAMAREAKLTKADFMRRKIFNDAIPTSTEDELTRLRGKIEEIGGKVESVSGEHGYLFMATVGVGIIEIVAFLVLLYKMPAAV